MVAHSPVVRAIWPARAVLGEGPIFDPRSNIVLWLDIKGRKLFACDPQGMDQRIFPLAGRLCSIDVPTVDWRVPDKPGTHYLGCGDHGFGWITLAGETVSITPLIEPKLALGTDRFNDGKVGCDGRYWAGTMDDAETASSGALYAFASDASFMTLDEGYRVTNGPAFVRSRAGATVLHTDSAAQTIYAFALEPSGKLRDKRVWKQYAPESGCPDGMTVDTAGNIYVAMWDGWRVDKLSPQGELLDEIAIPTARPTSCALAPHSPDVLFVTSAAIGRPASDQLAGSLFRVDLNG